MKYSLFFLLLIALTFSCIDDYKATTLPYSTSVLVVEGFITNQTQADTLLISFSKAVENNTEISPVTGCVASIITDDGASFSLKEATGGKYYTPSTLRGKIGKSYQLKFITPNGNSYESSMDKMNTTPPIVKVYDTFEPKAVANVKGTLYKSANQVYIDVQDPANEVNFYLWRYLHFEKVPYCITCETGILLNDGVTCQKVAPRFNQQAPTYDYQCAGDCWDIIWGNSLNVFSDINSNGNIIKGRQVANIPFYTTASGAVVEIQQYGISADGYRFFKLLSQQGQSTGSLTDTPPAAIVGNIKNVNNNLEPVVGFFGAAAVRKVQYYLDRANATGPTDRILGHEPNLEPYTPSGRPPFAKCLLSTIRTPTRPDGWPK